MIKAIVDTNVIVSAIIGKGYSTLIVNKIFEIEFEFCISKDILIEYQRVIQYPRLTKKLFFKERAEKLLNNIIIFSTVYFPETSLSVLSDPSDNKFLEVAVTAKANYLITGNHLHFNFDNFQGTKIVSPKTFYELYQQNNL